MANVVTLFHPPIDTIFNLMYQSKDQNSNISSSFYCTFLFRICITQNPRLHFVMKPVIFMCAPYQVVVS